MTFRGAGERIWHQVAILSRLETHNILDIKQGKMYNCVFNIPELSCEFYEFGNAKALNFASDLIRDGNANKGMESLINIK